MHILCISISLFSLNLVTFKPAFRSHLNICKTKEIDLKEIEFTKMCAKHTDSEFEDVTARNYNKLSKTTTKNGYKDGVHDGRESMFQPGFDSGYKEGFKNAFNVGKFHGLTTAAEKDTNHDLLLKKPTRGHCQICTDTTLLDKSISEIISAQSSHSKNVNETLNKRYNF